MFLRIAGKENEDRIKEDIGFAWKGKCLIREIECRRVGEHQLTFIVDLGNHGGLHQVNKLRGASRILGGEGRDGSVTKKVGSVKIRGIRGKESFVGGSWKACTPGGSRSGCTVSNQESRKRKTRKVKLLYLE